MERNRSRKKQFPIHSLSRSPSRLASRLSGGIVEVVCAARGQKLGFAPVRARIRAGRDLVWSGVGGEGR
jgi:hypothetical protein